MCAEAVLSREGSVDDIVAKYKDIASLYDVSYSQVYSWVKKYDADGKSGSVRQAWSSQNRR